MQSVDTTTEFERLADSWKSQVAFMSSLSAMAMIPEYQQIIGMGKSAIPQILRELERQPHYWFWALEAITRENPVPQEDRGRLNETTSAWLKWGREHGYL